ncbi:MAG: formamidopyrimidine-DNA glycosylase/DNA-(apurinic or apyrimidinic site) lyase [Actinomycetota bacterium]|jgi:formamidopyrimidine-DNA glycosylase
MPELPEVETVRRGLDAAVLGRRIDRVEVGRERTVRRTSREALIAGLQNTAIVRTWRRGKYLIADLDSGDSVMIHLRMSGRLLLAQRGSPRPPHSHVVMGMQDIEVRFVDPRTFGEVVVFDPERTAEQVPELQRLGVDPIADPFDQRVLAAALAGTTRGIKSVLLDQTRVAGLGNIYTDEVLHRARLRYDRPADALRRSDIGRLAEAITEVLTAAIDAGGSTLADTQYVDMEGRTGSFQESHLVYARRDEPCLTCGRSTIRRAVVSGRSTFFCPRCQK